MENQISVQLFIVGLGPILTQIDNKIGTTTGIVEDGIIPFFPFHHGTSNRRRRKNRDAHKGPFLIPDNDPLEVPISSAKQFEPRLQVVWVNTHGKSRYMKRLREWLRQKARKRKNWIEEAILTPNEASDVEILGTYFCNHDCYGN
jgi:hypothetical protein